MASPTTLVFCSAPDLAGCIAWGRPTPEDATGMLEAFEALRHPKIAPRFDVVLDGRAIEGVDPSALVVLLPWLAARKAELLERVRVQWGVIADTLAGVTLSGILPVLGETHDFRIVRDTREAFCAASREGDAVCDELEAIVAGVRSAPRELRALRDFLQLHATNASLASAARALRVSVRSLQRVLQESGTSFRDELRDARFALVRELLVHGDEKIAAVGRRVGLSESAILQLVREKTGTTPGELRRRERG